MNISTIWIVAVAPESESLLKRDDMDMALPNFLRLNFHWHTVTASSDGSGRLCGCAVASVAHARHTYTAHRLSCSVPPTGHGFHPLCSTALAVLLPGCFRSGRCGNMFRGAMSAHVSCTLVRQYTFVYLCKTCCSRSHAAHLESLRALTDGQSVLITWPWHIYAAASCFAASAACQQSGHG